MKSNMHRVWCRWRSPLALAAGARRWRSPLVTLELQSRSTARTLLWRARVNLTSSHPIKSGVSANKRHARILRFIVCRPLLIDGDYSIRHSKTIDGALPLAFAFYRSVSLRTRAKNSHQRERGGALACFRNDGELRFDASGATRRRIFESRCRRTQITAATTFVFCCCSFFRFAVVSFI